MSDGLVSIKIKDCPVGVPFWHEDVIPDPKDAASILEGLIEHGKLNPNAWIADIKIVIRQCVYAPPSPPVPEAAK